ncbi:hypothetical protein ABQZ99_015285 [Xanthomonas hortorum pv. vitians]|uniref:Uncharacterized protein n=1 Tax=Xanthomonas hortorum pv. vitians TaxID=83224 RepID=A0AAW8ZRD6_9XANT|nr:hypothetical protein [Xanthomonas hortorum]MCC8494501.1 hypothetical protein [Xanthomonas hortorum pv. gardneri]MCE4282674.1 hypothetical protein [Xanthomonas hortorum pv. vitians]MCE4284483.1 hypothetical protein [Xanthomonas hortorum pv. vitians]MCE4288671.1 hypothetical protein [Xanthomonas hortorum pv. vitians]MCE4294807.1 hypothetical protein [Xanthomonas hortorum pv. vitians]
MIEDVSKQVIGFGNDKRMCLSKPLSFVRARGGLEIRDNAVLPAQSSP